MHYNCFRYYDPLSGQYTQQDPIGLEGGTPLLSQYVDDPVGWIDPLGLHQKCGSDFNDYKKGGFNTNHQNQNANVPRIDAAVARHGGKKIGRNRYQMPNKRSAKKAASEISGNLGSRPETVRRRDYMDVSNSYKDLNSNRVIGKQSYDGSSGYHDHSIGHQFDRRPHLNAWSKSTSTTPKNNVRLYY